MRLTYDREADAAYIYLVNIPPGGVHTTHVCDVNKAAGQINFDFDEQGRLLGIEVLSASRGLPKEVLKEAQLIDSAVETRR